MYEKEKLDEARFFFDKMKDSINDPNTFKNNLSAFLTAGRCVLQYAHREVTANKTRLNGKEVDWYNNKMNTSPVFQYCRDVRKENIHEKPVKPTQHVNVITQELVSITASVSVKLEVFDIDGNLLSERTINDNNPKESQTEQQPQPKGAIIEREYYFTDYNGTETVIELSEKYLEELESFVDEGIKLGYLTEE